MVEPSSSSDSTRQKWTRAVDFLFACVGFSVGLGNVWRFPYLCYKNGGGAFLIPYFICVALGGVPVFFLEVAIGQYMQEGCIGAWKICPLFQGIGFAMTVIPFLVNSYYNVILAWAFYYLFASFQAVLPWSNCDNDWNTPNCIVSINQNSSSLLPSNNTNSGATLQTSVASIAEASNELLLNTSQLLLNTSKQQTNPVTEYWERQVLQLSSGIDDVGTVRWELALCLLLAWVIVYFCIWKGIKSSGKVMYFTATAPYVLLTILLVRGLTLPGAGDGIRYYLVPQWSKLADTQVWVDAGTQIFYSYSIAMGALTALGSFNKYHHNSWRDCMIFACTNSGTSLFAGFVIFSILGFMAHEQGVDISTVAESGPGLAFIAYPQAVSQMPVAPLWSIFFFLMIILLGLDSQFVGVEGFVTAVTDMFPVALRSGRRRELFILAVCAISFVIGLSMITNGGMYVFQIFDYYASSRIGLLIALFQCIVISYVYGIRRFYDNLTTMLGFRLNPYMAVSWCITTPLFTIVLFTLCVYSYTELTYNRDYHYPAWAIGFGWTLSCCSIVMIPVVMVVKVAMEHGSLRQRIKSLIRPRLQKHQLRPQDDPKDLIGYPGISYHSNGDTHQNGTDTKMGKDRDMFNNKEEMVRLQAADTNMNTV